MATAREITAALRGRWFGSYGSARCVAHQDRHPSMTLRDGEGGRVLVYCYAGCDRRDILAELRRRGLADKESWRACRPGGPAHGRPSASEAEARDVERRIRRALGLWREAIPAQGTPAERYLRRRGYDGAIPPTLRFHPCCWHRPSAAFWPALIAAVTFSPSHAVRAIHRTFLARDGGRKAPVQPEKMALAPVSGGAVRLAPAGPELVVAEGIETALSVQQATGIPAWSALSASGIEALELPEMVRIVYLAADHDPAGLRAAESAARRWLPSGRSVRIVAPPRVGSDWNDVAREVAAHA